MGRQERDEGLIVPTTLVLRFPFGRYHATPWGRHVNEGQVELPPSPWRVLRALYAVWKTRVPDLDEAVVRALLGSLAVPPHYFVPEFTLSHTRHYYPDSMSRTAKLSVDKTLDAFAAVGRDAELGIRWSVDLPDNQAIALEKLAGSLPYLGRADSICEARVEGSWKAGPSHAIYAPVDVDESIPVEVEAASLLAAKLPLDFEALVARPVDIRANKLLFPAATRFVGYRKSGPERSARPVTRARPTAPVRAVRLAIVSPVKPPMADTVVVTDLLRLAALSRLGDKRDNTDDSHLAGRYADKSRMLGQHSHSHYLASSNREGRLDDLIVWAPAGLDEDELVALSRVRRLWSPEGAPGRTYDLTLRLTAYGDTKDVLSGYARPAIRWRSSTPFVPSRHYKSRKLPWEEFVQSEIERELGHRGIREQPRIALAGGDWRSFARYRPSKRFAKASSGFESAPPGVFVTLEFERPVPGPLILGHLSHFGLGVFVPM